MPYELPPMRPPSEARSLLIRVMRGCPWNYCTFCSAYKNVPRKALMRSVEEVKSDIDELRMHWDEMCRQRYIVAPCTAFLADSNAIIIKTVDLIQIVAHLLEAFPSLERVTSYGRAKTVLAKGLDELRELREAGLNRLHLGLESGDDGVLERVKKGANSGQMISAGLRVKEAGFELSEYVMPGLGGLEGSQQHVEGTARVLNAVDPDYTRVRSLILAPGTPLHQEFEAGRFQAMSELDLTHEIRALVERLEITGRLCFDHFSNPPFFRQDWEGYKFPEEKEEVLSTIDSALERWQAHLSNEGLGPVIGFRL
ncbi:MAG: radical SAM protein [Dehalococcoidia bacterium]